MVIDFGATTKEDFATIRRIVNRAAAIAAHLGITLNKMSLMMDIEAAHNGDCPLDLERWLASDDVNFTHDVGGIIKHMDRETGKLGGCFSPRYAKRQG